MNENQMKYVANLIINLEKAENTINDLRLNRKQLLDKISLLHSNWNSLREWIMQLKNSYMETDNIFDDNKFRILLSVLDKMNELEGVDND